MSSPGIKNISLFPKRKSGHCSVVLAHTRGVSRSSRCVGQGCDGRSGVSAICFRADETPERTAKSCGPDTRCWCQAGGKYPAVDGDKTNSLTGESTKYAVKPLRRGCRSVSAALYARVRLCAIFSTRDRGCSAHPAFPAPSLLREGQTNWKTSGKPCRENEDACF